MKKILILLILLLSVSFSSADTLIDTDWNNVSFSNTIENNASYGVLNTNTTTTTNIADNLNNSVWTASTNSGNAYLAGDENTGTHWNPTSTGFQYIQTDLGNGSDELYLINKVVTGSKYFPGIFFGINVSIDGNNWVEVYHDDNPTSGDHNFVWDSFYFPPIYTRYIRIISKDSISNEPNWGIIKTYQPNVYQFGNFTLDKSSIASEITNVSFDSVYDISSMLSTTIHASTDGNNWTLAASNVSKNTIIDLSGNNYTWWKLNINTTTLNETMQIINFTTVYEASDATPTFTYTSANTTSYENELDTFTANSSQSVNVSWLVNGAELQTNTSVTTFSYSNSTALNGTHNITAIISNVNGSAQHSWSQLKLLNSVDIIVTYEDRTNTSYNVIWNVSNITAGLQHWNVSWNGTDDGNTYNFNYWNGTNILSQTATSNNQTLWFNSSILLDEGTYYISESLGQSTLTIPANSWGMFNNWTGSMTFAGIAANESNDVYYTYYNVTNGLWESYYVGYSWNSDYQLSKNASVIGYFDTQTNITSNIITPSSTELYTGWNMLGIQSSSNQTISGIIADIGANCSDSWYFNSSTGGYSNTTTHSIQPNQGFLSYIIQNMTWTRSTM